MSTFLLDDVGLCLLRQLNEAWDASESFAETAQTHDYIVTSTNDLWRLDAEYTALAHEFFDHLLFIYSSKAYRSRLTHKLWSDVNIPVEMYEGRRQQTEWYIAKKSVQAYKRMIRTENEAQS